MRDVVDQFLHWFIPTLAGCAVGVPLAVLNPGLTSFVPALLAFAIGHAAWWVWELYLQWPINPDSDMRLDTAFWDFGKATAAVASGIVAWLT